METIAYFIGAMFAVFDAMYQVYVDACKVFITSDKHGMMIMMFVMFVMMFALMVIGAGTIFKSAFRRFYA